MYKYVILGNGTDWCKLSLTELNSISNVKVINKHILPSSKFIRLLYKIHHSGKINNLISLPFKSLWNRFYEITILDKTSEDAILVFYDRNQLANNESFLNYLIKRHPNIRLIYKFTNVVRISGANTNRFVNKLNTYYDITYAFDPSDSDQYGFKCYQNLYSYNNRNDVIESKQQAFFLGRAKDRLGTLLSIFSRLKALNIENDFYITDVEEDKQLFSDEILYNKTMSYSECIRHVKESSCVIDVIQGNSSAFTLKVSEAVFYNKLLITTNESIKFAPFYDERYIRVIKCSDDIDCAFFSNWESVDYGDKGYEYFSCKKFLEQIDEDLSQLK